MKNSVIIKSYRDGIAVYLDETLEFEQLVSDVENKFRESARFFGDTKVDVSFEGRSLSGAEENRLVDAITGSSSLHVVCVVGKDREKETQLQQTMEAFERYFPRAAGGDGKFYRGNLTGGQILETEGSIVVIGNVEAGCSVISTKDIIVLGGLYGSAYAGGSGVNGHFIAALEMAPQKLKIGDFKYRSKEKTHWPFRAKKGTAQIAWVKDGQIQMQAITNELLNELPL